MFCCVVPVAWFVTVLFLGEAETTIISKSDITICENAARDPLNVLENKKCEKKMVVTATVQSGQGETEKLYAHVKKVYDSVEKEDARLYNPFIITLSMSPIYLVYPVYYRGTVNNKPYEMMIPQEDYGCDDAECEPHYDQEGHPIFDSKGFCCECQRTGIYAFVQFYTFSVSSTQYKRGQIDCDKYHSSAHCMLFDQLWYDVHEIGVASFDFTVWVKTYDQMERQEGNKTVTEWVDGGQLTLTPQKKSGVGKYGRVVAKYIGRLSPGREYVILQDHYLMVPNVAKLRYGHKTHPQIRNGYEDYLIIPFHLVEFNNSQKCDVIGVSLSAFAQQSTHQKDGYGCYQKQGTCLRNQIKDFFEKDQLKRDKGERTQYFPESYGKITGLKERVGSDDRVVVFESEESTTTTVYLEISADDLILIYNRAGGLIVKAYAKQFEAQSRNGLALIFVQNTGFVTADFYVTLEKCSDGIRGGEEKRASINPQTTYEFQFRLESYIPQGGAFACTAVLYDARRTEIDRNLLNINTTSTCICIHSCGCSCTDQEFVCVNESDVEFDQFKPATYSDFVDNVLDNLEGVFETIGDVFDTVTGLVSTIWNFLPHLGQIWTFLIVIGVIIILCVLRVVCSFMPTGVMTMVLKKAAKTVKSPERPPPPPPPTVVVIREEADETEESDDNVEGLNTALAEEIETRSSKRTGEFLFEFFFFFILPLLIAYKVLKLLWDYSLGPVFRWVKNTLLDEEDESSEDDSNRESNIEEDASCDENRSERTRSDSEESGSEYSVNREPKEDSDIV